MKKKVEQKKPETLEVAVISKKSQLDREHNDDNFYLSQSQGIFAVFDGVSQGGAGYEASEIARRSFEKNVAMNPPTHPIPASYLTDLLNTANSEIKSGTKGHTTGIAGMVDENGKLMLANVGDSAAYLLRDEEIYQISHDQTIAELVKLTVDETGALTGNPEKLKRYSSIITNYLGKEQELTGIDAKVHFNCGELDYLQLEKGDLLMLATDGITCNISEDDVKNLAMNYADLDELLKNIVAENYRAVEGAGDKYVDDITIIALRYLGENMQKKNVGRDSKIDFEIKEKNPVPQQAKHTNNQPFAGTTSQATYANQSASQNAWNPDEFVELITSTKKHAKPGFNQDQTEEKAKEKNLESAVTDATVKQHYRGSRKHRRYTAGTKTPKSIEEALTSETAEEKQDAYSEYNKKPEYKSTASLDEATISVLAEQAYSLITTSKYVPEYKAALEIYEKLISEVPENEAFLANGANTALYLGDYEKALEWSQSALEKIDAKQYDDEHQKRNEACQVLLTRAITYQRLGEHISEPQNKEKCLVEAHKLFRFLNGENYLDGVLKENIREIEKSLGLV